MNMLRVKPGLAAQLSAKNLPSLLFWVHWLAAYKNTTSFLMKQSCQLLTACSHPALACLFLQAFLGPKIRRQWTMAKDTSDSTTCQVLPFLLDISLALYDTLDLVKSSVDSEVVFQATLQVGSGY
jgi:hypothetical protein